MVCQDEETKYWTASKVPTLTAWEGSRLKMMRLDALPTYKKGDLILGPVEDTGRYFQQLRRQPGLDTSYWRVYERKEELKGSALYSV